MASVKPVFLQLRVRSALRPGEDEPREIVEVLHGDEVIGQLPVSRAVYELLPGDLPTVRIDVLVQRANVESLEVAPLKATA